MSEPDVHNTVEISTKGKMTTLKPITKGKMTTQSIAKNNSQVKNNSQNQ